MLHHNCSVGILAHDEHSERWNAIVNNCPWAVPKAYITINAHATETNQCIKY